MHTLRNFHEVLGGRHSYVSREKEQLKTAGSKLKEKLESVSPFKPMKGSPLKHASVVMDWGLLYCSLL